MKKLIILITLVMTTGCVLHGHDPDYRSVELYSAAVYDCSITDFDYMFTHFDCAHDSFTVTFCDPSGYYISRGGCIYPDELEVYDHSCRVTNQCRQSSFVVY